MCQRLLRRLETLTATGQLLQHSDECRPRLSQLRTVIHGEVMECALTCWREMDNHLPPVSFAPCSLHIPMSRKPVHQLHHAVVSQLQPLGECRHVGRFPFWHPLDCQHQLVLLWLHPCGPCRILAKPEEQADRVAEFVQSSVVVQGDLFCHILSVYRLTIQYAGERNPPSQSGPFSHVTEFYSLPSPFGLVPDIGEVAISVRDTHPFARGNPHRPSLHSTRWLRGARALQATMKHLVAGTIRKRSPNWVRSLVLGEGRDAYAVVSELGQRLGATLAPEAVLPAIVETVSKSMNLPYVGIALKHGDEFEIAAEYGLTGTPGPGEHYLIVPLVYQGEVIGQMSLAPRVVGEDFDPKDRQILGDLARQAGVAAYGVRLTADLQRSRERLVNAREEERRRIRRDLHDGIGPALAALTLKLDAAGNLLERDPAAAAHLIAELRNEAQDAVSDVRRLVYGLRPPALDDLGLVPAIRQYALQYGGPGSAGSSSIVVTVDAPENLPPLPAALEVVAYRVALEGITNAARHANARNCVVRLSIGDAFAIEVIDDGNGLRDGWRPGVGFASIGERAGELGGTCTIDPEPSGGVHLTVRLPLQQGRP